MHTPAPPPLTFAFELSVLIGPGLEVGDFGGGRKRIVPILGGNVSGRLSGVVLPGGADWQTIRPSGVTDVWARYTVQADDGAIIVVTNAGVRRASPEVSARLAAGERVAPEAYYFRTAPVFETGAGAHAWLTDSMFVGVAERRPDKVVITVFQVS
jgi:hypothetical protein